MGAPAWAAPALAPGSARSAPSGPPRPEGGPRRRRWGTPRTCAARPAVGSTGRALRHPIQSTPGRHGEDEPDITLALLQNCSCTTPRMHTSDGRTLLFAKALHTNGPLGKVIAFRRTVLFMLSPPRRPRSAPSWLFKQFSEATQLDKCTERRYTVFPTSGSYCAVNEYGVEAVPLLG